MTIKVAAAFLALWVLTTSASGQAMDRAGADGAEVRSCSSLEANGARTLCQEIVVPAPRDAVWALLSSSEALRTWVAPFVALDLRIGGLWEASYRPDAGAGDANIRNRVLSYAPGRMLSIQVDRAPPGFPHADLVIGTWSVIELQDDDPGATRVRVSGMGYGAGADYDELYAFFERGNAWTLQQLRARVVNGPTDWNAVRAPEPAEGQP